MIRGDAANHALFTRAAELVRAKQIETDADLDPLLQHPPPDVDPELINRLRYMHEAGAWVLFESALADLPADLRWLFESSAITVEQLATLHRALGCTAAVDLGDATERQSVRKIPGFDERIETAVAAALPNLRAEIPRIPLGRALSVAEPLLARLRQMPGIDWALPVGSLRRGQDTVGDIELAAASDDPSAAIEDLTHLPDVSRVLYRSPRRVYLLLERVQVGVRFPPSDNAGSTLLHLTGSAKHLAALGSHAGGRGWRLTADGLFTAQGEHRLSPTEEDIYSTLGLPYITPEIRNGDAEIDVAGRGELPELVSRPHVRGDLHMHTTWSDGHDSIEAMVRACCALGYESMAITDHSEHSAASRNLTTQGVSEQAEEIARLREQHPEIAILHGCEVEIMPDGRLDFADTVLERFDIVLASLHERSGQSREQLLKRYVDAMKHPLVTIITHPTNRLVPNRRGYDLDYDRFFEVAVATGTVVEIDGAPVHLDLDGALARRAIAAGATVSVNSDSHRAEALERQMGLGILTARRGWVEPRHVLNTRPVAEIRALVASKRGS